MQLLSTANPKIQKGTKFGYLSFILHLAPAELSGRNTCARSTAGCRAACLNTAGRGGMFTAEQGTNMIQQARIRKTRWFFEQRDQFMLQLVKDIQLGIRQAARVGLTPVFRLNGTSDLAWEKYTVGDQQRNLFQLFPTVQFYDYTKILGRKASDISNYHLTFSAADGNDADVARAVQQGYNIAAVFDRLPEVYLGMTVIDADQHDLRFLDPKGSVCGLKAKGRARKDTSGFVRRTIPIQAV
jgi:hypothetical protein